MSDTHRRILVLNIALSGINRFLYSELEKRDWDMDCFDVPYPPLLRYWAQLVTIRPWIRHWKTAYRRKLGQMHKSPRTFRWRSRYCQKLLEKHKGQYDLIFQISGMYAPSLAYDRQNIPYTTFNDYTVALSSKYPDWSPSPAHLHEWLELEKEMQQHACTVFTTSENTRQSFINDYSIDPGKVVNVGYGVTLDGLPDNLERDYSGNTVLFVGIDFKRKGGFVLLNAFKTVREAIPDARLIIVGPNKELYDIKQPGVDMLGNISDREALRNLYLEASVFAMPSFCEPFGLVFLEAMGYRLPCVATTVDAMSEIIEDERTGYLVPPGDEKALAQSIIRLLKDQNLCESMGRAGYQRLQQYFRWEKVGNLVHQSLLNCLSRKEL